MFQLWIMHYGKILSVVTNNVADLANILESSKQVEWFKVYKDGDNIRQEHLNCGDFTKWHFDN